MVGAAVGGSANLFEAANMDVSGPNLISTGGVLSAAVQLIQGAAAAPGGTEGVAGCRQQLESGAAGAWWQQPGGVGVVGGGNGGAAGQMGPPRAVGPRQQQQQQQVVVVKQEQGGSHYVQDL
jgi:hypothetical protein